MFSFALPLNPTPPHPTTTAGDAWLSRDGGATWAAAFLPDRDFYSDILDVEMSADGQTLVVLSLAQDGEFVDVSQDNSTTDYQFQRSAVPEKIVFYLSTVSFFFHFLEHTTPPEWFLSSFISRLSLSSLFLSRKQNMTPIKISFFFFF